VQSHLLLRIAVPMCMEVQSRGNRGAIERQSRGNRGAIEGQCLCGREKPIWRKNVWQARQVSSGGERMGKLDPGKSALGKLGCT